MVKAGRAIIRSLAPSDSWVRATQATAPANRPSPVIRVLNETARDLIHQIASDTVPKTQASEMPTAVSIKVAA